LPDVSIFLLEIVVDPQEIAIERISQDEVFASVARIINQFPAKQRRALLADLARRMDLRGHPTALQQAFLNEGIQLEDYQQPLSEDAGERNRYLSALSTAYKRLRSIVIAYSSEADPVLSKPIKEQQKLQAREDIQHDPDKVSAPISKFFSVSSSLGVENMSSQTMAKTSDTERYEAFMREITHMNKSEKEQADKVEEQDAPMILEDPELARLALHLRQTPPPIDPAYRAALQSRLLEIVHAQRPRRDGEEVNGAEIELETKSEQNTQSADTRKSIDDEPDTAALEDEAELEFLACHLQQTIPPVPIDPRFRAALQEKLLEVVRRPTGAAREKMAPDILSLKSGCPI